MSGKTTHGLKTRFGYKTPHKYPKEDTKGLIIFNDLSVQLYPTGRAWYKPEKGVFDNTHKALNQSFERLVNDGNLLIDGLFPDNDNFTTTDATYLEYKLGLMTNENLDLEIRKAALRRKLGHPNNVEGRQSAVFIESQLRLAGFDVFVHENQYPYRTPEQVTSVILNDVLHGGSTQHGNGTFHGGDTYSVIANSLNEIESYAIGEDENLWATFFIGGKILGNIATVERTRLREFKELVIKLKPAHLVAFTFITYN